MLTTLAALAATALAAGAVPCVQFDTSWNLYAFGGENDVNLGPSSSWSSPNPQTLTSSGRPPWTGNATQCFLSQYNNAMYVLGADASDPSSVYVYSFSGNSWSTQQTSGAPANFGGRSGTVLDHDTNVLFTLPTGSGASMYSLDMSSVTTSASSSSLAWQAVSDPSFSTNGYSTTAAQASNHIVYFGVPGTAAGSGDVFVIHYSYFQPEAQSFPTQNGGATFPDTAGQAITMPNGDSNSVGYQMLFVPSDFSGSYVVTHWTDPGNYATTSTVPFSSSLINSTQVLPAPTRQDAYAAYAASNTSIVQVTESGEIWYIGNAINSGYEVNSGASWTQLSYSLSGVSGGSSASASASGSATGSTSAGASMTSGASRSAGASKTSGTAGSGTASASAGSASQSAKSAAGQRAALGHGVVGAAVGLVLLGLGMTL